MHPQVVRVARRAVRVGRPAECVRDRDALAAALVAVTACLVPTNGS